MDDSKNIDVNKIVEDKINKSLSDRNVVYYSMLYKPQKFTTRNSLNMLKYSNFLHGISPLEQSFMEPGDRQRFEFSLDYVRKAYAIFLKQLLEGLSNQKLKIIENDKI